MIRSCTEADFDTVHAIINDAAEAYRGIIPVDRWKEPYMRSHELRHEMDDGVVFSGWEEDGELVGVMGIQDVGDVTLIRHAYVRTSHRNRGIGGKLLARLTQQSDRPVLIGTWADAVWAIAFYEKHGLSERRACRYLGQPGSTQRRRLVVQDDEEALNASIVHFASRYG